MTLILNDIGDAQGFILSVDVLDPGENAIQASGDTACGPDVAVNDPTSLDLYEGPVVRSSLDSRTWGTQFTFGPVLVAHVQANLLVVALRPSRIPDLARMVAPVQTEMRYLSDGY